MKGSLFWMLLAAALFGYFGWAVTTPNVMTPGGQPAWAALPATLHWTLRGASIGYGAAFLLTIVAPRPGMFLYGGTGFATAALMLVCAAWDFIDNQIGLLIPPFLLLIFAVWNGYVALDILSRLLLNRDAASADPAA